MEKLKFWEKNEINGAKITYEHIGVAFDFPNLYAKLTARENLAAHWFHTIKTSVKIRINCLNALAFARKRCACGKLLQGDEDAAKFCAVNYAQSRPDVF
jgi:ABC-type lipoprotein export system ATPase subunit